MRTEIEKKEDNCALYLAGERKEGKKNLRWRSDYHTSSHACITPCEKGHDDAFKETKKGEVWPLGGVTCTS